LLCAAATVPEQSQTEQTTGLIRTRRSEPSILILSSSSKFRYAAYVQKDMTFIARAALDLRNVLGVGLFPTQESDIRSQCSKVTQSQTGLSEARSILTQHNNVFATVPILEAYLNCKYVVFSRDEKAHSIHCRPIGS
jgi:hypothetical protein